MATFRKQLGQNGQPHTTRASHLGTPAHATVVSTEGNTLVLDGDVTQVLVGLADVHALDGLGCLTGVLGK